MRGSAWVVALGMNPRPWLDATVVGCHMYMKPKGGNLFVAEPTTLRV